MTHAWLALLQDEPGAAVVVADLLERAERGDIQLFTSLINVGEVYYRLFRQDRVKAQSWRDQVPTMPVVVVMPTESDIWSAAELKAKARISYADGFAANLARRTSALLVTGDPEFASLSADGVNVLWLKRTSTASDRI